MQDQFGSHKLYTWTHAHLVNVLCGGADPILKDPFLINAFKNIDRADFVPENLKGEAYSDKPLEIGYGQTISQPTTVAKMLSLLRPREGKKYLDIGAGSGYAAALLAYIAGDAGKVFAIERNQYLADMARLNISKYPNLSPRVEVIFKDGSKGLVEKAPYDFIHAAAAFDSIPLEIRNQLAIGGRMIAPTSKDDIRLIERVSPTEFDERIIPGYLFVPIIEGIE
ncbi:protein-L-isoaspartate O-methyltransferase [Candidatus Dojkabacteria bacterium]|nr:protein-L-isoaspartate O-methyltransferase [Candidatus Dojkabacteria bacterium]